MYLRNHIIHHMFGRGRVSIKFLNGEIKDIPNVSQAPSFTKTYFQQNNLIRLVVKLSSKWGNASSKILRVKP
jgi:hypothetical protein